MAIDERILGLAFVSLLLSGLIVFTLAREKADRPIELLKNQFPSVMPAAETTFSFALVARERIADIRLEFYMVTPAYPVQADLVEPRKQYQAQDGPLDVLANVARLGWFRNRTASVGLVPEEISRTVTVGKSQFRLLLQDYTTPLHAILGENATLKVPLIYGAMINETGYACYLEGGPNFFAFPELNINVLTISHNEDEKRYVPLDKIWEGSGQLPLSEAPRGVVEFKSVAKDDTMTVILTVEPKTFSPPSSRRDVALIQLIQIYLDGELYDEPVVNVVR